MPPGPAPPAVIRPYALVDANNFYVELRAGLRLPPA